MCSLCRAWSPGAQPTSQSLIAPLCLATLTAEARHHVRYTIPRRLESHSVAESHQSLWPGCRCIFTCSLSTHLSSSVYSLGIYSAVRLVLQIYLTFLLNVLTLPTMIYLWVRPAYTNVCDLFLLSGRFSRNYRYFQRKWLLISPQF